MRSDIASRSAITGKSPSRIEDGLAAGRQIERTVRTSRYDVLEVSKRLPGLELGAVPIPGCAQSARARRFPAALPDQQAFVEALPGIDGRAAGHFREVKAAVLLPIPIRGKRCQAGAA